MFSATDMKRTCPDAFARFVAYDKVWRDLMLQMSLFMHATACLSVPDLEDALGRLEGEGAALQEALGAYLAAKRRACARLYFLSDGQLLDLLREVGGYVGYQRREVSNLTLSNVCSVSQSTGGVLAVQDYLPLLFSIQRVQCTQLASKHVVTHGSGEDTPVIMSHAMRAALNADLPPSQRYARHAYA